MRDEMRTRSVVLVGLLAMGILGCAESETGSAGRLSSWSEKPRANEIEPNTECPGLGGERLFEDAKGSAAALDGACVPEISRAALDEAFFRLRDTRLGPSAAPDAEAMLVDERGVGRRLPWLLADNGCEERAPAAAYLMHAWGYPTPFYARAKAKLRKSLHLQSPNFPTLVTWSSHVAPVLKSQGRLWVLDPAVEPRAPITVDDWLVRITYGGSVNDLDAAFCRDEPSGTGCVTASPRGPFFPQQSLLGQYLPAEWRLQQILGRVPEETLGDCPPWKACFDSTVPVPSRAAPPVLKAVISADHGINWVSMPLMIIGENFGEAFTKVRLDGEDFQGELTVTQWHPRALEVFDDVPSGPYRVTVFNDDRASRTLTVNID